MTVHAVRVEDDGRMVGSVTWNAVPEIDFTVEVARGGDLLGVAAKAKKGHRISARRLRLAPVGEMQRRIREFLEEDARGWTSPPERALVRKANGTLGTRKTTASERAKWQEAIDQIAEAAASFETVPRPGAAGRGDRHYAAIAKLYVSLLTDPRPTEALAERLGVSPKTASNYLFKAREKNLLTSLGRGRAGGELTAKAKEVLGDN